MDEGHLLKEIHLIGGLLILICLIHIFSKWSDPKNPYKQNVIFNITFSFGLLGSIR